MIHVQAVVPLVPDPLAIWMHVGIAGVFGRVAKLAVRFPLPLLRSLVLSPLRLTLSSLALILSSLPVILWSTLWNVPAADTVAALLLVTFLPTLALPVLGVRGNQYS